jgi:hypothetical protein
MTETLLSISNVILYGRQLLELRIDRTVELHPPVSGPEQRVDEPMVTEPPEAPPRKGDNNFLARQVLDPEARFARIYAFSYEGHYYDLAKPAIFLVHGPGSDPEAFRPDAAPPDARVSRAPADADRTGVASSCRSFSHDMRAWSYDKGDFSIRLDPDTGPLEQILLQAEIRTERMHYAGDRVRLKMNRGALGD